MRYMMTVRVITEHHFEVEADDEQQAHALAYEEVAREIDRDQHVEISARECTP